MWTANVHFHILIASLRNSLALEKPQVKRALEGISQFQNEIRVDKKGNNICFEFFVKQTGA